YGYLDTWHGVSTLALLPLFVLGLVRSYTHLCGTKSLRPALQRSATLPWVSCAGLGRLLLLMAGVGMIVGGGTIMVVGMTNVFVPQDLAFMQVMPSDLAIVNPRLIALIA